MAQNSTGLLVRATGERPPAKIDAPVPTPLFRAEAVQEQQAQWLGSVLLEPRLSSRVFACTALAAIVAILALLLLGSYTRKERINGWLVPELGLARVHAPQQGVVKNVLVKEGASVGKGEPLVTLSGEVHSNAIGATRAQVASRLKTRRDSISAESALQSKLMDQQADSLQRRLAALKAEQGHVTAEIELQRRRYQIAARTLERHRAMRSSGLATEQRLEQAEHEIYTIAAGIQTLARNLSALRRQEEEALAALADLPLQRQTRIAEIERNAAALEQDLAENEARRELIVVAPQDGIVSEIQVMAGDQARLDVPLLGIVPAGSSLRAQLFAPSRAIGFIRPGQSVLLRYKPYPFQKFGLYRGTVVAVSATAIAPGELPRELRGLSSLYGSNEPVYRITVELASQTVTTYGKEAPLQAGMQLEADVQIERRRLIEWLLHPVFSLTRGASP